MARVTQKANPPDLLGPPAHITLELQGGQRRSFELWGGYLVDKEQSQTYAVSEALFSDLQSALEPLSPPPIEPPKPLAGRLTPADLVLALQEHGAGETRETGETLSVPLFGAQSGEVIEVLGFEVQVYTFTTADAAQKAASQDPMQLPIDWIGQPYFVAKSNLLITVVHPDEQVSRKILAYLAMIEVR